jgi:hypothetical protein
MNVRRNNDSQKQDWYSNTGVEVGFVLRGETLGIEWNSFGNVIKGWNVVSVVGIPGPLIA